MNKVIFGIALLLLGLILLASKCNRNTTEEKTIDNTVVKKIKSGQPVYDSPEDSMRAMESLVADPVTPGNPSESEKESTGKFAAVDKEGSLGPDNTDENSDEIHIIVGQGGGFTGAVTTHSLSPAGSYQKKSSLKNLPMKYAKMDQNLTSSMFSEFNKLNLDKIEFHKPGNMYYFVGYRKGEEIKKITWGSPTDTPPAEIKTFYDKFYETIIKQ